MPTPANSRYLVLFLIILSLDLFAQPNRNKNKGYDATYWQVRRAKYKWGESVKVTTGHMIPHKDQWFYQDTAPLPGFVELKDGTRIEGQLVKRYNFNKSSTYKIKVEGVKKTNPEGKVYYEALISEEGAEPQVFKMDKLVQYGIDYAISDFKENEFEHGQLLLKSGLMLEGEIFLGSWKSGFSGMKYHGQFMIVEAGQSKVRLIQSDQVDQAIVAGDVMVSYLGWQVAINDFKKAFTDYADDNKFLRLSSGRLSLQDGSEHIGLITLEDKKKIRKGLFLSSDERYILHLDNTNLGGIALDNGDKYLKYQSNIRPMSALAKRLNKNGGLTPGTVQLADGTLFEGKVGLEKDQNAIASYRSIIGVYIIPNGNGLPFVYDAKSKIDKAMVGGKTYIPINNKFIDYDNVMEGLTSAEVEDPLSRLQPGYVSLIDGTKLKGRIASRTRSIWVELENGKLSKYGSTDEDLDYYVQRLNGKDLKFVPMLGRDKWGRTDHFFIEIQSHDQRYALYRNPYPTHVKKMLTRTISYAANKAMQEGREKFNEAAVRQAASSTYDKTGDVEASIKAARDTYAVIPPDMLRVRAGKDEGIFFQEYVIMDNRDQTKHLVYPKNDRDVLTGLLQECPGYHDLPRREKARLTRFSAINASVEYLNACVD